MTSAASPGESPAPSGLAEAEQAVRSYLATSGATPEWALSQVMAELDRLREQRDAADPSREEREVLRLAVAAHNIRPLLEEDDRRSDLAVVLDRLDLYGEQRDAVLAVCDELAAEARALLPLPSPHCGIGAAKHAAVAHVRRALGAAE